MNRQDLNKIVQGLTFTLSIPDIVCVVHKAIQKRTPEQGSSHLLYGQVRSYYQKIQGPGEIDSMIGRNFL